MNRFSPRFAVVLLGLALVAAAPAGAATPKQTIKTQRAQIARLKSQLASARTTITTLHGDYLSLKGNYKQAQADLATRTTERDTANTALATASASLAAQQTLTTQAAAGSLAGLSADQLWAVLVALYPLMPNADICGYSRSFYASGNYTSYTFTSYVC